MRRPVECAGKPLRPRVGRDAAMRGGGTCTSSAAFSTAVHALADPVRASAKTSRTFLVLDIAEALPYRWREIISQLPSQTQEIVSKPLNKDSKSGGGLVASDVPGIVSRGGAETRKFGFGGEPSPFPRGEAANDPAARGRRHRHKAPPPPWTRAGRSAAERPVSA